MPTSISDLWVPAIWVKAMRERQATFPALWNSGIVTRGELMDQIATGAGTSANVPFLNDITDQADEVQVENTAPVNEQKQPGGVQNFPILNRVTKNGVTALSAQVSGVDPLTAIIDQMTERRLKQRQTTMIALLRGLFGTGATAAYNGGNANTAALGGVLYQGPNNAGTGEIFTEDGANATTDNQVSPDVFIDCKALMGELGDLLKAGCILVHPNVKARLEKLDALNFKKLILPSELPFEVDSYRGVPMFTSVALARPGAVSGYVYETYLISRGSVGYGEKPQGADTRDVASLQYFFTRDTNTDDIWDRTRFILGVDGTKWIGTPAGQSAQNSELQAPGNWQLVYQTPNRCGCACFRSN